MDPRSLLAFVLLSGFVRPLPIALGVPPQSSESGRESGRWLVRGKGFAEFVQRSSSVTSYIAGLPAYELYPVLHGGILPRCRGTICVMENSLIEKKHAQRKALLRGIYGLVDGREGFTITPMQYFALGTQMGLQRDVTGHTVRFLVLEGLLEYKPASEAVALTHKGVVEVERQSDEVTPESQRKREAQLKALPDRILGILKEKPTKIQIEELKEGLPEFADLSDPDWYVVINDLLSDGLINAGVARSGIYGVIGAAFNIEITPRGRALTPEQPVRGHPVPKTILPKDRPQFDVFVSHATEDKRYVERLVEALEAAGIRVWFDKNALEWGDDLRSSIDRGLSNCRYGVVVFSKEFLGKKKWTEYELNSLFALEQPGKKIILPIWHGITRDDLLRYGAGFADRLSEDFLER